MSWEMPTFCDDWHDDIDEDVDNNTDRSVAAVEDIEADDGENCRCCWGMLLGTQ